MIKVCRVGRLSCAVYWLWHQYGANSLTQLDRDRNDCS